MVSNALQATDPHDLGARLQHARRARGVTQAQAAEHLGVARTTITAIEKGQRRIKASELMSLAGLYGRSVNELLRNEEPDPSFGVQLRSAFIADSEAERWLADKIDDFERLAEDYRELEQLRQAPMPQRYPPPYDLGGGPPEHEAELVADAERNRLGVGDGPLINLRSTLENDVGIRVFYMDLPSKVAAMFAYTLKLGGCVAVNRNHPAEKRRLSAAHEYGHFLTRRHQAEVAILGRYQRVPEQERFADAFSRAFLMPQSGLRRRFSRIQSSREKGITPADLCRLAHVYFVSVEAMTLRLEELSLLPSGTWERLSGKGFRVREAQSLLGLPQQPTEDNLLPRRYMYLATEAYESGQLSEGQFARFLRVDRLESRRIAEALATELSVDDDGELSAVQLELGGSVSDVNRRRGGE
ncbi:MAG TPA: XRE family transcriptional regulator [Longimicrobiaceae bacterium]